MSTTGIRTAAAAAALALALPAPRAEASAVEVTSQLSVGGGARFGEAPRGTGAVFAMALRADVLFGRGGPRTFGLGPYLSLRTDGFADFAPSLGASLLVPVTEAFPLVFSAGIATRLDGTGAVAGALERVWFGPRSYNYHSAYALSAGLFVEARQFADAVPTVDVVGGVDLDLELFALPFIGLYSLVFRRGS